MPAIQGATAVVAIGKVAHDRRAVSDPDSSAADSTSQALPQTRTAVDEGSCMAADPRTTVGASATDPLYLPTPGGSRIPGCHPVRFPRRDMVAIVKSTHEMRSSIDL
ncbi:hypothetical protein SAMN04515665_1452 [Blastococcus sp. DSM 46786]|nr:hypothetical protein SAMN04515665_1452 [Blastococcus sp. DSM 46786]